MLKMMTLLSDRPLNITTDEWLKILLNKPQNMSLNEWADYNRNDGEIEPSIVENNDETYSQNETTDEFNGK